MLSKASGWEVMKRARAYLEQGEVLSSNWTPPLLRGVVQAGEVAFRASMVIKGGIDIENLCNCREAREWGKICAHGVAVGLHWLKAQQPAASPTPSRSAIGGTQTRVPVKQAPPLQRDAAGEPAELFIILPPNVEQAIARGKVMLVFEAKWSGGRCPLSALPKGRSFAFSSQDNAIIERLETLTNGEMPALLQMETRDFAALLPALAEHPNITLGKSSEVTVTKTPLTKLPLRATLEANGEIVLTLKDKATMARRLGLAAADVSAARPAASREGCLPRAGASAALAGSAVPESALAAVAGGRRRRSQLQAGRLHP